MDEAAKNGHLDVVMWLHENRQEGCTGGAMDMAGRHGHLEVRVAMMLLHTSKLWCFVLCCALLGPVLCGQAFSSGSLLSRI